jgi:pimeloyl-ACP methyl ester carboxylesterase
MLTLCSHTVRTRPDLPAHVHGKDAGQAHGDVHCWTYRNGLAGSNPGTLPPLAPGANHRIDSIAQPRDRLTQPPACHLRHYSLPSTGRRGRHDARRSVPRSRRGSPEPSRRTLARRLDAVQAPTLVLVGEEDVADFHQIAAQLSQEIRGAQHAVISNAAHLPSLERPAAFNELVLPFLARDRVR